MLKELGKLRRVPYEFPMSYKDTSVAPVHQANNVTWALTTDVPWLLAARGLLRNAPAPDRVAIRKIEKAKLEVKIFKTDRSLTGKDKTNRAKRWEVLPGDFQHATLEQCWSAERKLTADLVAFFDFPKELKGAFVAKGLVAAASPATRCPVTLEELSFAKLASAILEAEHGVSDYQIGHLHPLKRGGKHDGSNVCWESQDGNRIQGDLTIEETDALLESIFERRQES
jgi:hypothetical protein